jgi:hypothetical protein
MNERVSPFCVRRIGKALSRSNRKVGGKGMSNQQYDTASVHVTFISNQVCYISYVKIDELIVFADE